VQIKDFSLIENAPPEKAGHKLIFLATAVRGQEMIE
jgi:hypothetical protein